jgi:hypothetical protein
MWRITCECIIVSVGILNKCDWEVLVAKLWGILEGLHYVWQPSFRCVTLHNDSSVAVHIFSKEEGTHSTGWSICRKITRLSQLYWKARIYHRCRETNVWEDVFAHIDCDIGNYVMFCKSRSTNIRHLVANDQWKLVLANYYVFFIVTTWTHQY